MAQKIDSESLAQFSGYTFRREKVTNIEEVARVLSIQRGDELAGIKVFERYDPSFCQSELLLDYGPRRCRCRFEHAAAQDRCYFDLDLYPLGPNDQFDHGIFGDALCDLGIRKNGLDATRYALHRGVDIGEGLLSRRDRQTSEIDIDREAWQVSKNRLIAVPPLRAKHFSSVTRGRTRMSKATCRL
jgi:hypothetical protein